MMTKNVASLNDLALGRKIKKRGFSKLSYVSHRQMLQQIQSPPNHTSITKGYFNKFVPNVFGKKSASSLRKKMRTFFSFRYKKFRVRVNHTITNNQQSKLVGFLFGIKMPLYLEF